jgi:hypothetical protein
MRDGSVVDFNGFAPSGTTGRYDALTNLSNISEMRVGDGLILDIVYQEREIIYVVEVDGDHQDPNTMAAKGKWIAEVQEYQSLIATNADSVTINY